MRIIAMIQARMGSTRLPGKTLMPLGDKTVLDQVLDRVLKSKLIDEVMVVTTIGGEDLKIVELCEKRGVGVFQGSVSDVLDRYYQAAKPLLPDHIVRITADCPLIDADIIDQVIKKHLEEQNDYTSNVLEETFPDGEDNEIFTFKALEKSWHEANLASEREHVTLYIRNHPETFKLGNLTSPIDLSKKRWTLDNQEDYLFIQEIYKNLYYSKRYSGMADILALLKQRPELEAINDNIERNAGHKKSLREDKIIKYEE